MSDYGDNAYGTSTYGGGERAYTGRLGNPLSMPSDIKLGYNIPQQPQRPTRPFPDMMTHVELGRVTGVALFAHATSSVVGERESSVYPDQ